MAPVGARPGRPGENRAPAAPGNPFLAWELLWADSVEKSFDLCRDVRDGWTEYAFHAVYGWLGTSASPPAKPRRKRLPPPPRGRRCARRCPGWPRGGYAEAVIRMMILLARARGGPPPRLARSNALLTQPRCPLPA